MYHPGMAVYEKLVVSTPNAKWVQAADMYCPHCGERGSTYILCGKKQDEDTRLITEQMLCIGCTYYAHVPGGVILNAPNGYTSPWYFETIEALKRNEPVGLDA